MGKRNFVAYLDGELIQLAKDRKINISAEFNQYLKDRLLGMSLIEGKKSDEIQLELSQKIAEIESLKKELASSKKLETEAKQKKLRDDIEAMMK